MILCLHPVRSRVEFRSCDATPAKHTGEQTMQKLIKGSVIMWDQIERGIGYAGIIAYSVLVFVAVVRLTIGA